MRGIKDCGSLAECDKYFENLLDSLGNPRLLGYIELNMDEIEYMADLVSKELAKPYFVIDESLTISIFLVWVGILHYQEGNFWSHVYNMLRLPLEQPSWQRRLGEIFLRTVEKYHLAEFSDKLRYIMPILAHGCVPNFYLRDYFLNVLLRLYKDRQELEMSVTLEETKHIVSSWRKEYEYHLEKEKKLEMLNKKEEELQIVLEVLENKDKLERLIKLMKRLRKTPELKDLLSKHDTWWKEKKAEREKLSGQIREIREILNKIDIFKSDCDKVENEIKQTASSFLRYWNEDCASYVLQLSIAEIENIFNDYMNLKNKFKGLLGILLRFLMPGRYQHMLKIREELERILAKLPIKRELAGNLSFKTVNDLKKLQELVKKRENLLIETEKEIAAGSNARVSKEILMDLEKRLEVIEREIDSYEENLKILGKGNLEDGLKVLEEQRRLRLEIRAVKKEIKSSYPLNVLLEKLSLGDLNEEEVKRKLAKIESRKREYVEKFEGISNPLYFLNESTRLFIFQGGELAEDFIFQSLALIQKLEKGEEEAGDIRLPKRIKDAMKKWWEEEGREKLTIAKENIRGKREKNGLLLWKPIIRLDTIERVIKVELPRQVLEKPEMPAFVIRDENAGVKKIYVTMKKDGDEYLTETVSEILERPKMDYHFELWQEDKICEWDIRDIWHNKCLLFSVEGKLLEGSYLPEEGVYIVCPYENRISPSAAVKQRERLIGEWSDYEYVYVDLSDIEMFIVERGNEKNIFRKRLDSKPHLIGGKLVEGVSAGGKPVYSGKLPSMVFSCDSTEQMDFYGVKMEFSGKSFFRRLKDIGGILKDENLVLVPLDSIFTEAYGICRVALVYKDDIVWNSEFALVPDLQVEFDKVLYPPLEKGKKSLGKIILSSEYPFKVVEGEAISECPYKSVIKFDLMKDQIKLEVKYFIKDGQKEVSIKLSAVVPKIYLRLNGADDWKSEVGEIWYADMGELEVKGPSFLQNLKVKLLLSSAGTEIAPKRKNEIWIFNLKQLSDIVYDLREKGSTSLQDLILSIEDAGIPTVLLARVRLFWEVADVKIDQKRENGKRKLSFRWEDRGKATRRIIRLWPLKSEEIAPIEIKIPDGESELEFVCDVEELPWGKYRLQFDIENPWSDWEISPPGEKERNCIDIVLGDREEAVEEILQKGLKIVGFEVEGIKVKLKGDYWIQDIRTYSNFSEGVEFEGNICTFDDSKGEVVVIEYNPCRFYFGMQPEYLNKLPYLVDRDSDGFTYCRKCKVIFSDYNSHKECGDEVILPEYIYVQIGGGGEK